MNVHTETIGIPLLNNIVYIYIYTYIYGVMNSKHIFGRIYCKEDSCHRGPVLQ